MTAHAFTRVEKVLRMYDDRIHEPLRERARQTHMMPAYRIGYRHLVLRSLDRLSYPGTTSYVLGRSLVKLSNLGQREMASRVFFAAWKYPRWTAMQKKRTQQMLDLGWASNEAKLRQLDWQMPDYEAEAKRIKAGKLAGTIR